MQDAPLAETQQSLIPLRPQYQQLQRHNQQFEGGENFDYYVDRKTGWRYYREPRRNPPANGKRVGAHGSLHHLRIGGDFCFLERIPENRRGMSTGHPLTTHICAVQSVHKRGTHRTRLAQELHNIFVRLKRICHLVRTCLTLTCRIPRAHHLPHSLFLQPRHQNTQHNRDNTIISKNTQDIMNFSRLSQSTSSAIKNQSGVKTCRVAETRARLLPQVMSPKSFRLSRDRRLSWRSIQFFDAQEEFGERDHRAPITEEGIWRNWDTQLTRFKNYQRRPTSNRTCISTNP